MIIYKIILINILSDNWKKLKYQKNKNKIFLYKEISELLIFETNILEKYRIEIIIIKIIYIKKKTIIFIVNIISDYIFQKYNFYIS